MPCIVLRRYEEITGKHSVLFGDHPGPGENAVLSYSTAFFAVEANLRSSVCDKSRVEPRQNRQSTRINDGNRPQHSRTEEKNVVIVDICYIHKILKLKNVTN